MCSERIRDETGDLPYGVNRSSISPVPLRKGDKAAAVSHETVDVTVHPACRGRSK